MCAVDRVEQVAKQLEEKILAGHMAPGDRLPPERELCAQLHVSRSVVREAIKRLQSLGLVDSLQGSANRVALPSNKPLVVGYQRLMQHGQAKLADLWVVRMPLETTIASLAAQHRTDEHLRDLDAAQAVLGDESATLEDRVQADLRFHAILADASGNPVFQIVLQPIHELLIESRRRTVGRFGSQLAHAHHAKILDAVRLGDSAAAAAAMQEHLQVNSEHLKNLTSEGG